MSRVHYYLQFLLPVPGTSLEDWTAVLVALPDAIVCESIQDRSRSGHQRMITISASRKLIFGLGIPGRRLLGRALVVGVVEVLQKSLVHLDQILANKTME
jgi:hypothetical protein